MQNTRLKRIQIQIQSLQGDSGCFKHKLISHFNTETTQIMVYFPQSSLPEIQFVIILDHAKYPYEAPYVCCITNYGFPRLDDSRNLLFDITRQEQWWPLTTIKQIIQKIPSFIQYIANNSKDLLKVGTYAIGERYSRFNLSSWANALKLNEAEYWQNDGVFIGKYKKCIIGLSIKAILVFTELNRHQLTLNHVIHGSSIRKFTYTSTMLTVQNKKKIYFKIPQKRSEKFNLMLRCMSLYMDERQQKVKEMKQSEHSKYVERLVELVELCSELQQNYFVEMYMKKIKQITLLQPTNNIILNG